MNQIENGEYEESDDGIELKHRQYEPKPRKKYQLTKPYEMTEKRKESFNRAKEKRAENIAQRKAQLEQIESEKRERLQKKTVETARKLENKTKKQEKLLDEIVLEPVKKKKKRIVIVESDDDSVEEVKVVKYKEKQPREQVVKQPIVAQKPVQQSNRIKFV